MIYIKLRRSDMNRIRILTRFIIGTLILNFLLSCSEDSNPVENKEPSDETRIRSLFINLAEAYNTDDAIEAMNCFSDDFLHNGNSDYTMTAFMEGFRSSFPHTMELSNITPEVTSEMATCSFHMYRRVIFPSDTLTVDGNFPQEFDMEVHILHKEESGWKIYGNQQ